MIEIKDINLKIWAGKPQSLEKKNNVKKVGQCFLVKMGYVICVNFPPKK